MSLAITLSDRGLEKRFSHPITEVRRGGEKIKFGDYVIVERSLRTNYVELSHFLHSKSLDVLALAETKLDSRVPSNEKTPAD